MTQLQRTPSCSNRAIADSRMSNLFCSLSLAVDTKSNSSGLRASLAFNAGSLPLWQVKMRQTYAVINCHSFVCRKSIVLHQTITNRVANADDGVIERRR